ncbi:MAG: hypothetical protein ACXQTI_10850, partial [Candidatus Nezhaarchaeales archaeon]
MVQGQGLVFTDVVHETLICTVDSFDDVLDAAGAPYGATLDAVIVALNAFLNFKTGGGGTDTNFANTDLVLDDDRSHDGNEFGFALENVADMVLQAIDQLELSSNDVLSASSLNELRLIAQSLRITIPSADAVGKVLTLNNAVTKEVEFTDISGLGDNIYNANGALTGNRTLGYNGNSLQLGDFV